MAKFSRGHYQVLRDAIIKARMHEWDLGGGIPSTSRVVDQVALEIAVELAKDNTRFDMDKFLSEIRGYRSPALRG